MFFDAHAHLASSPKSYSDINSVITTARKKGVERIVDAAIDLETSEEVLALHSKFPNTVIPTIGIQPEKLVPGSDIYDEKIDSSKAIESIVKELRVIYEKGEGKYKAIGECGLDYYWLEEDSKISVDSKVKSQSLQKELFRKQIEFAYRVNLPVIVHSRGAEDECLKTILKVLTNGKDSYDKKAKNSNIKVLFHSFTGSIETAKRIFEEGYYISFNGILTYPKADDIREIFKIGWCNYREQVLSETDSPYLPPQSKRGGICVPKDVIEVVEEMSKVINTEMSIVSKDIFQNAISFYGL